MKKVEYYLIISTIIVLLSILLLNIYRIRNVDVVFNTICIISLILFIGYLIILKKFFDEFDQKTLNLSIIALLVLMGLMAKPLTNFGIQEDFGLLGVIIGIELLEIICMLWVRSIYSKKIIDQEKKLSK